MIDGVKIDIPYLSGDEWLSNNLLDFHALTSASTGELLGNTLIASYKNLRFIITQSTKDEAVKYCSVRGSLHKYFNNGHHNSNDFTFSNLQTVLAELHEIFNIDPKRSILRNIEFGVNIHTPITVKEILKNLVITGNHTFGILKIDNKNIGKKIEKHDTSIKIYNKGLQYKKQVDNLLRFEVAVKKMRYLKTYGIIMLSDLQSTSKIEPLIDVLLKCWCDIIYYDKKVNWKHLTEFERKKLLYYATPRNWVDFNKKQRYRAKIHFTELMSKHSTSASRVEIQILIAEKWKYLTAKIRPPMHHDLKENYSSRMSTNAPLEYTVKEWTNTPQYLSIIKLLKTPLKKTRFCKVCESSINHKRAKTKYCSKKCNNVLNGMKRTQRNKKQRQKEKQFLNKLIKILQKSRLWLLIDYKTGHGIYSDYLHQTEINTTNDWISKVLKIVVTGHRANSKPYTLTDTTARKLLKLINKENGIYKK